MIKRLFALLALLACLAIPARSQTTQVNLTPGNTFIVNDSAVSPTLQTYILNFPANATSFTLTTVNESSSLGLTVTYGFFNYSFNTNQSVTLPTTSAIFCTQNPTSPAVNVNIAPTVVIAFNSAPVSYNCPVPSSGRFLLQVTGNGTIGTISAFVFVNGNQSNTTASPTVIGGIGPSNAVTFLQMTASGDIKVLPDWLTGTTLTTSSYNRIVPQDSSGNVGPLGVVSFNGSGRGGYVMAPACDNTGFISALGATTTQIIAGIATQRVRICTLALANTNATATNVKLVEGTGVNCATGQAQLTGNFGLAASPSNFALTNTGFGAITSNTLGDSVCATGSAAGAVDVTFTFSVY